MQRDLLGLSLGFAALILLTAHAGRAGISPPPPLPTEAATTLPAAPR
jgi:hypothetical protein